MELIIRVRHSNHYEEWRWRFRGCIYRKGIRPIEVIGTANYLTPFANKSLAGLFICGAEWRAGGSIAPISPTA